MVINDPLAVLTPDLVGELSLLITLLQALGGVVVIYIIFNIINFIVNRKRNKKIDQVVSELGEIKNLLREQQMSRKK